jgi:uncharacterized membrane protein
MRFRSLARRVDDAPWSRPLAVIVVALLAGLGLSQIRTRPGSVFDQVAFAGDATAARELLAAVAGTMTTVTSLVFGLTVVALQLASTQYSPRLLRSFIRDRGTQLVLGTFVGTVAYSLAGLHGVGHGGDVPRLAVSGSLAMALLSLCMLVYYIGHVLDEIRVDAIMVRVERATLRIINRDHPIVNSGDPDTGPAPSMPPNVATVGARRGGYVQGVDESALMRVAARHRLTVRLIPLLGYHVVPGEPLAVIGWDGFIGRPADPVLRAVADAVELAPERLVERDVGLGIRQLVDISSRGMSTSHNDAYTAVQAVHHLTTVLTDASRRSFQPRVFTDATGAARAYLPVMDFPTHLKVVCAHVRQSGLDRHPRVRLELLRLLGKVGAQCVGERRLAAVQREFDVVLTDARRILAPGPGVDLDEVEETASRTQEALRR